MSAARTRPSRGLVALLLWAIVTSASPFARADVPELHVYRTEHFVFTYHAGSEAVIQRLARPSEAMRQRVCREIGVRCFDGPIRVHLATSQPEFRREQLGNRGGTRGNDGHLDWAAGIAYPRQGFILLRSDRRELLTIDEIFHHEVSHIAVRRGVGHRFLPRWFVEGLAILQAGEPVLGRIKTASQAALTGNLIPIRELEFRFPPAGPQVALAYAESVLFLQWLLTEIDDGGHRQLVRHVARGERFADAFVAIFGDTPDALWSTWRVSLLERASWLPFLFDAGLLWFLLTGIFLWVYVRKRRDMRSTLAAWDEEEARRPPAWYD